MVATVETKIEQPETIDDLDNPFGAIYHVSEWAAKLATQELSRAWRNDARDGQPISELVDNVSAVIRYLEDFKASIIETRMHRVELFNFMDSHKRTQWATLMASSAPFTGNSLIDGQPVAPEVPGGREIIDRVIIDLEDYEIHIDLFNSRLGPVAQIIIWWKVDDEYEADSTSVLTEIKGKYELMAGNSIFTITLD